ncbi:MAG TPA: hypothetical protein VF911_16005, partial [Thermoanaerobaculia bacterium]
MKFLSALFVCLLTPAVAFAQSYPQPGSANEPAVLCTGCPGNNAAGQPNDGKPLYPYNVPLVDHVGRVVDSSTTTNFQNAGMRTLRAGIVRIRPSRDRVYVQLGSTVAAYTLSTFFTSTLQKPMVPVNTIVTHANAYSRGGAPFETLAMFDAHVYVESKFSGWTTNAPDVQIVLSDFDSDDRGYLYIATSVFGWGIHFDDGRTDGKHLPFVAQHGFGESSSVRKIISLKRGDQYFAVVGYSDMTSVYDVTAPGAATPVSHRFGSANVIKLWDKSEAAGRVAIVDGSNMVLRIYTTEALVAGTAAIAEHTLPAGRVFTSLSFDENGSLWVTERTTSTPGGTMWKLAPSSPSATSYEKTVYELTTPTVMTPNIVHAAAGYLAVVGSGSDAPDQVRTDELRLFKLTNGTPSEVATDGFFRKHYRRAPSGYANPSGVMVSPKSVQFFAQNGLTYMMFNADGLGDVYELGAVLRPPQLKVTSISPVT